MQEILNILVEMSKYLFAGLITLYTLFAYVGATIRVEKKRTKIYVFETLIMFSIHLLGYILLYLLEDDFRYAILYFVQFALIFMTIMIYDVLYPKASRLLINNMCLLLMIGFIIIGRLDFDRGVRQTLIAAVGTVITFFIPWMISHFKGLRNLSWLYCLIGVLSLAGVWVLGRSVYGANLNISIAGITFQPSEFIKIIFILFVASMYNKSTSFPRVVVTTLLAIIHIGILIASNDLGTGLIFFVVYLMMLFVATHNWLLLVAGTASGAGAAAVAIRLVPHVATRIEIWKNPWATVTGSGYQICQSLFAIGAGGWFGSGLLRGMPDKVPVVVKDFIFAAISEELGIIFGIAVLLICLNNLILMMNIASRCITLFYRLVAVGIGAAYGFQVFLTVGSAMNMIPMTGVTLPFVSYGGSSVISALLMFGLINGMYNMRKDEGEVKYDRKKKQTEKRSAAAAPRRA